MKYIYLSHVLGSDTPSYGNKDKYFIRLNSSIKNGDSSNTSSWFFSNNHIGTHIDVPFHFCISGKKTSDYSIEDFIFNKIEVIDINCEEAILIDSNYIKKHKINSEVELLIIRTGYEKYRGTDKYWNDNPGLSSELGNYFRSNFPKLRCIGFDFISLTSWKFREEGRKSHKEFLCPDNKKNEILIIEDMKLSVISENKLTQVIVVPVITEDGNGGPVTVIASI